MKISRGFPWIPGFQICSMAKNENPEMPEIHKRLHTLRKKHYQWLSLLENCYKATNLLSKFHSDFNNKKGHFQASMLSSLQ